MKVKGVNRATLSRGSVTYLDGDVRAVRGAGRYINRPCHAPYMEAVKRRHEFLKAKPVER